jgi:hypothetical protein
LNSTDIKETCKQLIDEATAIIKYTDSIDATEDETLKAVFEETRHDELGHVQKLTVALTEILSGGPPTEAEKMDDAEPKPPDGTDGETGEDGDGDG